MDEAFKLEKQEEMGQLFQALEKAGLYLEKYRIETLMNYLDGMEGTFRRRSEELRDTEALFYAAGRKDSILEEAEAVWSGLEKSLKAVRGKILELQKNMLRAAGNAVKEYREQGQDVLSEEVHAFDLPEMLTVLKETMSEGRSTLVGYAGQVEEIRRDGHNTERSRAVLLELHNHLLEYGTTFEKMEKNIGRVHKWLEMDIAAQVEQKRRIEQKELKTKDAAELQDAVAKPSPSLRARLQEKQILSVKMAQLQKNQLQSSQKSAGKEF